MSDIRVTYSGLISFVLSISAVVVGLGYSLIVTRNLSPQEFGTWSLITTLIAYFLISERIVGFWTTRQLARGELVGKTSLMTIVGFSVSCIPIYLAIAYLVAQQSNAPTFPMLLAALLLPVFFVNTILKQINVAHKPQANAYSLFLFEFLKLPMVLLLVVFFSLGIEGVIFAVFSSYLVTIGLQMYFARNKIRDAFNFQAVKRWFRLSWIPLYSSLSKFFKNSDVLAYSVITGTVEGLAYYAAAVMVAKIVQHSSNISKALYPKILSKGNLDYIPVIIALQMYFAIPLLTISSVFAQPIMFALNPLYEQAFLVAIIIAFRMFLGQLGNLSGKVLKGIDEVDLEESPKFRKLLKSKIFFTFTIKNIQGAVQITVIIIVLLLLTSLGASDLEMVIYWVMIPMLFEIPFAVILWNKTRHYTNVVFPWEKIAKYCGASAAMVAVFYLTSPWIITYHESIYDFLPGLIIQLVLCIITYFGITYLVDKKTRTLVKAIILEIRRK